MNKLKLLLMVFMIGLFSNSWAQAKKVSGVVLDADKLPIPGVSVLVKNSKTSTSTDFDGKFIINAADNATLIFSFVGSKTQEVAVNGRSTLKITMVEEQNQLNEVVVIGYGSSKKKDLTGAVDMISAKNFDGVSNTSPALLLRGKVAGVQITQSSGEPGSATTIRVRGTSSVRSGNGPLIVVDGVPLGGGNISPGGADTGFGKSAPKNPLNFINEADIESLTVLKDASSTAIYGARGANGVIVITTKKGKSQKPELTFSSSVQINTKAGNYGTMDADQFVNNRETAGVLDPAGITGAKDYGSRSYNWEDAILQTGISINNSLSFTKSTEDSNTRISFASNQNDGIVKNTGMDRYTASVYNSNNFFDGVLKIESRLIYSGIRDTSTLTTSGGGSNGNVFAAALYWNPTRPIYDAAGNYTFVSNTYYNPVELLNSYSAYADTGKLLGSINTTIKMGAHFKYQVLFGIETSNATRKSQLLPTFINGSGISFGGENLYGNADIATQADLNKTLENTIVYDNKVSDNFNINALVGYSYYDYNSAGNYMFAEGYNPAQTNLIDDIQGGVQSQFQISSYRTEVELQSFYARATATLYKDFILTGTIRVDGSSKLGLNDKYGSFPSLGAAYNIISDKEGTINDLKLRVNWGITGNQEFAANSAVGKARYGNNGALSVVNNANPDLRWETTTSYGIGTDFTFFDYRLTGTFDYFQRNTKQLIFPIPAEATQPGPASVRYSNLPGNLVNNGLELTLDYKIIDSEKMSWRFGANVSYLKNEMKNFQGFVQTGGLDGPGLAGANTQVITGNKPLYTYNLFEFRGYDADGNSLYTDSEGNPNSLAFAKRIVSDKQPLPKYNFGFNTSFSYKAADISVSFYGAAGNYIYNNTENAYFVKSAYNGDKNITQDVALSQQNTSDPNTPSTKFLQKGNFLRMGELTLGYTFKGAVMDKMNIKNARVFINGSNLLLFTKYKGFDPEVDTDKTLNGVPSAGIDYLSYPRSKGVACGFNVTF